MLTPPPWRPLAAVAALAALWCAGLPPDDARAAGSKKRDPSISVRFHEQVSSFDPTFAARVRVGNPPQEISVEKSSSLSERDIASFYPYRAADGSYGVVLKLDRHGEATLEVLSTEKRGSYLLAVVNGRPITPLMIDRTIRDGIIYLPSGLTEADIRAMGASFSILGRPEGKPGHGPSLGKAAPPVSEPPASVDMLPAR